MNQQLAELAEVAQSREASHESAQKSFELSQNVADEKISNLSESLATKNTELAEKSAELVELALRLEEMVDQSESLKEKCKSLEENKLTSGAEADQIRINLENSLHEAKNINSELLSSSEKLQIELEGSKQVKAELEEKLAAETAGREAAISTKDRMERKLDEVKNSLSENLASLEEEKHKTETLREMNLKMEEEIQNSKIREKNFEENEKDLKTEIMEKESQILSKDENIEALEKKCLKLKKKAEEAGDFELKAVELQSRYEELEARIRQNGHVPTTPDSDLNATEALNCQVDFLNSIISDQQAEIKGLKGRIGELEQMMLGDVEVDASPAGDETAYFDLSSMSSTVKTPTKPIRSYCEICETFDTNCEAEGCPEENDGENFTVKNTKPIEWDDDETF